MIQKIKFQRRKDLLAIFLTMIWLGFCLFSGHINAQTLPDIVLELWEVKSPSEHTRDFPGSKGIYPYPPLTDRETQISFRVSNHGLVAIEKPFTVELFVDNRLEDTWTFSPLSEDPGSYNTLKPGKTRISDFALSFKTPGKHRIRLIADRNDIIEEGNIVGIGLQKKERRSKNNIIDLELHWQYPPDLIVDFNSFGQVSGGQKSDWTVIVTNQGKGDVHEAFLTTFFPSATGGMQENFVINGLKAGQSVHKTIPQSFHVWGNHLFSAEVDVGYKITESYEKNNKVEKIIKLSTVDIAVKSFEYEKKKDLTTLRFVIVNNGPGDANLPFKVSLWPGIIHSDNIVSPKIFDAPPLPAGHQITFSHTLSLKPQTYEVLIRADAVKPVYWEEDEINNAKLETISLTAMPVDHLEANKYKGNRMDNIVRAILKNYEYKGRKLNHQELPWKEKHENASKIIAAGLYALSRPSHYSIQFDKMGGEANFRNHFQNKVTDYLENIYPYEFVGSEHDYDMALTNLATILYGFIDKPELLTNDMIWSLIHQSKDKYKMTNDMIWYMIQGRWNDIIGQEQILDFNKDILGPGISLVISETENHVLMIHTWKYLINQYIYWVGKYLHENDTSHDRYDSRIQKMYSQHPEWYDNQKGGLEGLLFKVLGRFLHNGVFEENARPYESFSLHAVMNLYMGTDAIKIPKSHEIIYQSLANKELKTAAQNAMEFLFTKYTFQSFEGKRIPPFRRNYKNRRKYGVGNSDYLMDIMGMLSGAYVFNDNIEDQSFVEINRNIRFDELFSKFVLNRDLGKNIVALDNQGQLFIKETIYKSRYRWQEIQDNRGASYALWTALMMHKTNYTLPSSIHDFLLNKHQGYWARINSIYTNDHYDYELRPGSVPALYFYDENGKYVRYSRGTLNTSPEFYFCTPDFLNSAGGFYQQYNKRLPGLEDRTNQYNFNSIPYTVLPKGDVGRFWGLDGDNFNEMTKEILVMKGHVDWPHESNNIWTYKNFSYGYIKSKDNSDKNIAWPMFYPQSWDQFPYQDFSIGNRASFRVINLKTIHGFYVILGHVRKECLEKPLREYGRGFWEIVPGYKFATLSELVKKIKEKNPPRHFPEYSCSKGVKKGIPTNYRYKLVVSGDLLVLDQYYGESRDTYLELVSNMNPVPIIIPLVDESIEFSKIQGIKEIWEYSENGLDLSMKKLDLLDVHTEIEENEQRKLAPLIDVWEVDSDFRFTNKKFAFAKGDGILTICNPFVNECLILDSSNIFNPKRMIKPNK